MRRTALLTLSAVAVVSLAVTACSNDNPAKSKTGSNKPSAGGQATTSAAGSSTGAAPVAPGSVDTAALSAALSDWALNTAKPKYPDISPPIWSGGDNAVLAYLPAGADAVQFCQAINDFLTESVGAGFDRLSITVIEDMSNTAPLATSGAGADCS